ncbi:MAG TPA: glycosyltransferase family 4 protein, partial [Chthonomonadales bacterium]|nr:glycosyltransferase family 4 protein [Chthonomonadales bacterium]
LSHGPFDALFVAAGHVMHGRRKLLCRQPFFMTSDLTAKLLHSFGTLYGKTPSRLRPFENWKHEDRAWRYRNASALFPWSHWAAASMVEDYGAQPDRVHVIPPGVDLETWSFARGEQDNGAVNILFVGGDFYRKGGDMLLEWAAATSRKRWKMHLVTREKPGNLPPRVRIYNGLSSNDPRLMQLYRQADLFVLPTRGDCFSIASIEAMAAGLPVILSCTGGTRDIVRHGETGLLIPPGDRDALFDSMHYLLADGERMRQMGAAARRDAEQRFDGARNIRTTVEIMRRCLQR